jgi:hypothetical protein
MWRGHSGGTLLAVTTLLVLAVGVGPVAAAGPTVSVAVDGDEVADGGTVSVREDPTVDLSVAANATIESVEVLVDGDVRERFEPGSATFSGTVRLDLASGEHTLEVIATANGTGSENGTTRFEATVVRDGAGPFVGYTSPFETPDFSAPPGSTSVDDGLITLSGDLADDTGVASIRIERRYEYSFAGSQRASRAVYTAEDPGESFTREVLLGNGENDLTITYTDELGNVRIHEFELDVRDTTDPVVNATAPERTTAGSVRVRGLVSDNVKIDTVRIGSFSTATTVVLGQTSPEPDRERLSFRLDERIRLSEGRNDILVTATDIAGNTARQELDVVSDPDAETPAATPTPAGSDAGSGEATATPAGTEVAEGARAVGTTTPGPANGSATPGAGTATTTPGAETVTTTPGTEVQAGSGEGGGAEGDDGGTGPSAIGPGFTPGIAVLAVLVVCLRLLRE